MFGLYREKDVKAVIRRLKEDYGGALSRCKAAQAELEEENRELRARLSVLEGERKNVSEALIVATREGERIVKEGEASAENERKELLLLAEKSRLLLDKLSEKYPDEEDVKSYAAFVAELDAALGLPAEEEESGFDLDEVTSPKEPLDLEKLCKELGLMEDDA